VFVLQTLSHEKSQNAANKVVVHYHHDTSRHIIVGCFFLQTQGCIHDCEHVVMTSCHIKHTDLLVRGASRDRFWPVL